MGCISELGLASCLIFWPKPIRVYVVYPSLISAQHIHSSPLLPSSSSSHLHCCPPLLSSPPFCLPAPPPLLSSPLLPSVSQLLLPPFQLPSLSSLRLLLQACSCAREEDCTTKMLPSSLQLCKGGGLHDEDAPFKRAVCSSQQDKKGLCRLQQPGKWPADLSRL